MAVTKLLSITARVDNRVKYIGKPEKLGEEVLLYGYNCDPENADFDFECTACLAECTPYTTNSRKRSIRAYHLIQSFSPNDNVTPAQAHAIAKQLADQLLAGRYEYVLATHTDRRHIHSHIIFNSVSFINYQKFVTQPYKTVEKIRSLSDRLCIENGLSVIQTPQKLGYSYAEWTARRSNTSWRSELRKRIQFALNRSTSYDDFLEKCSALDVAVNDSGKHIKFMLRDLPQERWCRGKSLAEDNSFTRQAIQQRISDNAERKTQSALPDTDQEIVQAWNESQRSFTRGDIPIELPPNAVLKLSLDGLLVKLPSTEHGQEEVIFIQNRFVDFAPERQRYTIWIAPTYQYDCVSQSIEQVDSASYQGMTLIKRMERAWNAPSEVVDIPPEWIRSASEKGLLLSIPDAGVSLMHLDKQDFELTPNGCKARIFPHWSYSKDFHGTELITLAQQQEQTPVIDLFWMKYRSYERRNQRAELERLSQALWVMEHEGISQRSDFTQRAKELEAEKQDNQRLIKQLDKEIESYARAVISLKIIAEQQPLYQQWQSATAGQRIDIEAHHLRQLRLYERATAELKTMGIAPNADPAKLQDYIAFMRRELEDYQQRQEELEQRLEKGGERTINVGFQCKGDVLRRWFGEGFQNDVEVLERGNRLFAVAGKVRAIG